MSYAHHETGKMNFLYVSSLFLFTFVLSTLGLRVRTIKSVHQPRPEIVQNQSLALLDFSNHNETPLIKTLKDEHEANLKRWHMECFQETSVNPDLVLKLKAGDWTIKDNKLKDWVLCVLNKYDLMSKEAVFRLDTAMSLVPKKDWESIEYFIDECLPTSADEPREIAWNYAKCYYKAARDPKNKAKRFHYMTLFY